MSLEIHFVSSKRRVIFACLQPAPHIFPSKILLKWHVTFRRQLDKSIQVFTVSNMFCNSFHCSLYLYKIIPEYFGCVTTEGTFTLEWVPLKSVLRLNIFRSGKRKFGVRIKRQEKFSISELMILSVYGWRLMIWHRMTVSSTLLFYALSTSFEYFLDMWVACWPPTT